MLSVGALPKIQGISKCPSFDNIHKDNLVNKPLTETPYLISRSNKILELNYPRAKSQSDEAKFSARDDMLLKVKVMREQSVFQNPF